MLEKISLLVFFGGMILVPGESFGQETVGPRAVPDDSTLVVRLIGGQSFAVSPQAFARDWPSAYSFRLGLVYALASRLSLALDVETSLFRRELATGGLPVRPELSVYAAMPSLLWGLNDRSGSVRPYLEGGLGLYFFSMRRVQVSGNDFDYSDAASAAVEWKQGLALRGGGGVTVKVVPSTRIVLEAGWLGGVHGEGFLVSGYVRAGLALAPWKLGVDGDRRR